MACRRLSHAPVIFTRPCMHVVQLVTVPPVLHSQIRACCLGSSATTQLRKQTRHQVFAGIWAKHSGAQRQVIGSKMNDPEGSCAAMWGWLCDGCCACAQMPQLQPVRGRLGGHEFQQQCATQSYTEQLHRATEPFVTFVVVHEGVRQGPWESATGRQVPSWHWLCP